MGLEYRLTEVNIYRHKSDEFWSVGLILSDIQGNVREPVCITMAEYDVTRIVNALTARKVSK